MTTSGSVIEKQHNFAITPGTRPPRSVFNGTQKTITAIRGGQWIPIMWFETLPGDTHTWEERIFARFQTLVVPPFTPIYADTHYFAVPKRILWDSDEGSWARFLGEREDPDQDNTDLLVPRLEHNVQSNTKTTVTEESIYDYFDVPPGVAHSRINALYFRAMNKCFNEWLRDQDLQDRVPEHKDNGPDPLADYTILKRGRRHDYLTACRPFAQKGADAIIPLGTSAPVIPDSTTPGTTDVPTFDIGSLTATALGNTSDDNFTRFRGGTPGSINNDLIWNDPGLVADLSNAVAATVNEYREAIALQQVYEMDARHGSRMVERIKGFWGVTLPDFRAQRPEYIGGNTTQMNVHAVAQQSGFGDATGDHPQLGDLGAYGTFHATGRRFSYSSVEECVVIGFISVRCDQLWQEGLHREHWLSERFDYPVPQFMHVGEQAVANKEIYVDGSDDDEDTFGFMPRYDEWRYGKTQITGRMRSSSSLPLDQNHLGLYFDSTRPVLNASFIEESPPFDRVIAVNELTEPSIRVDALFPMRMARPLPTHAVPGLMRL